ncbi:MAG: MFS transporter [Candidatus Helarchaeota archaeon]
MVLITEKRSFRYSLYSSVYLTEGFASILLFIILPIYLKNYLGLSDLTIAILASISILPVLFKPIVAILSDRYTLNKLGGKRKPYMVFGFIINSITLSTIGMANPVHLFFTFMLIWVCQSLGIAFMDVALDALIVESFPDTNEKLNANIVTQLSVLVSIFIALPIAFIFENGVIRISIHLTSQLGFDIFLGSNIELAFIIAGIIGFFLIIPALFLTESETTKEAIDFSKDEIIKFLKSKNVKMLLLLFFTLQFDNGLTEFTLDPFFRILGLTSGVQILSLSPLLIFAVLGTLSSRWFQRKGVTNTLIIFSLIFSIFYLFLALLTFLMSPFIPIYYYGVGIIISFFSNAGWVLYMTLAMRTADKKIAATSFVLIMMMINIGKLTGIIIGGLIPFSIYIKMGIIFLISCCVMGIRIPIFLKLKHLDKK